MSSVDNIFKTSDKIRIKIVWHSGDIPEIFIGKNDLEKISRRQRYDILPSNESNKVSFTDKVVL